MIDKLTGEPVPVDMKNVLKRLAANKRYPETEIMVLYHIDLQFNKWYNNENTVKGLIE